MILIGISTHYIVILQTNDIWMSWEALGRDIRKNNPKTEGFNKKESVVALPCSDRFSSTATHFRPRLRPSHGLHV